MKTFEQYDKENPNIWDNFKKYSLIAKEKGFKNYSAKSIFEIIRWHTSTTGKGKYKLNNNYTAGYARKMMDEDESFKGFFRIRGK